MTRPLPIPRSLRWGRQLARRASYFVHLREHYLTTYAPLRHTLTHIQLLGLTESLWVSSDVRTMLKIGFIYCCFRYWISGAFSNATDLPAAALNEIWILKEELAVAAYFKDKKCQKNEENYQRKKYHQDWAVSTPASYTEVLGSKFVLKIVYSDWAVFLDFPQSPQASADVVGLRY